PTKRKSRVAASQHFESHALLRRYAALPVLILIRGFLEESSPTAIVVRMLRIPRQAERTFPRCRPTLTIARMFCKAAGIVEPNSGNGESRKAAKAQRRGTCRKR